MSPGLRRALVLLGLCVVVVVLRVTLGAMSEERRAVAAEGEERWHQACVHHGRAIHQYVPLSPIGRRAGRALLQLADDAEARGEPLQARFCLEELRSGFLATRSMWQPGKPLIAQAEERLVRLMLADERGAWPDPSLSEADREAAVRDALAAREDPKLGWVLLMGLGYLVWLGAAAMAITQGLPSHGAAAIRWRLVWRWGMVSALGYGLWVLGVALA